MIGVKEVKQNRKKQALLVETLKKNLVVRVSFSISVFQSKSDNPQLIWYIVQ